ncbi:MAG: DUF3667 domain-containing protein [Cyclobacteriaceae bacterium]
MSKEKIICKSCSNTFYGSYCNVCGEKVINPEDRKLRVFIGDLISALTFADSKFWKSIKVIAFNPGRLSLDFIEGRRVGYMKPISIFFLANLMYFIFPYFSVFNTSLGTQMNSGFHWNIVRSMVKNELVDKGIAFDEYEKKYNTKTTELSKLLLILMAVLLSLFLWITHFGKNRLIADQFVLSLEYMTFILFYPVLLVSLLFSLLEIIGIYPRNEVITTSISLAFALYFIGRAEYTFFGSTGIRLFMKAFIGLISLAMSVVLYRILLFFVTFLTL